MDALEPAEKLNALIRERLALERQIEFAEDPLRAEELKSFLRGS
jgi:hypothetical protein